MKRTTFSLTALLLTSVFALGGGEGWMTDLDKAFAKAKAENKPVLVEFTGSDWCPPCMMMREKVFTKEHYIKKASEKFILVEIDIPNGDPDLKKKNMPKLKEYGVQGVPTVILFNPKAKEFDRFGAAEFPSVDEFIARLDKALDRKDLL